MAYKRGEEDERGSKRPRHGGFQQGGFQGEPRPPVPVESAKYFEEVGRLLDGSAAAAQHQTADERALCVCPSRLVLLFLLS